MTMTITSNLSYHIIAHIQSTSTDKPKKEVEEALLSVLHKVSVQHEKQLTNLCSISSKDVHPG